MIKTLGFSHLFGGSVKSYNHFGELFGSFL